MCMATPARNIFNLRFRVEVGLNLAYPEHWWAHVKAAVRRSFKVSKSSTGGRWYRYSPSRSTELHPPGPRLLPSPCALRPRTQSRGRMRSARASKVSPGHGEASTEVFLAHPVSNDRMIYISRPTKICGRGEKKRSPRKPLREAAVRSMRFIRRSGTRAYAAHTRQATGDYALDIARPS